MILKILLYIFFCSQSFINSPVFVINFSVWLNDLRITYFFVICKYCRTDEYEVMLGYLIHDSQRNISSRKYRIRFPE